MIKWLKQLNLYFLSIFTLIIPLHGIASPKATTLYSDIRLYALDCGYLNMHDGSSFAKAGFYPHKPLLSRIPVFLIKHQDKWLLWDLGLGDQYVKHPFEDKKHDATLIVPISLSAQLRPIRFETR